MNPHIFVADITRVVDGDTIYFSVDLGFTVSASIKSRLYGIDTPEIRGEERPEGLLATAYAKEWLARHAPSGQVLLRSHDAKKMGQGKYGRWLVEIFDLQGEVCLNDALVEAGHAELVTY
jgi:micrococcal nuclease